MHFCARHGTSCLDIFESKRRSLGLAENPWQPRKNHHGSAKPRGEGPCCWPCSCFSNSGHGSCCIASCALEISCALPREVGSFTRTLKDVQLECSWNTQISKAPLKVPPVSQGCRGELTDFLRCTQSSSPSVEFSSHLAGKKSKWAPEQPNCCWRLLQKPFTGSPRNRSEPLIKVQSTTVADRWYEMFESNEFRSNTVISWC